MGKTVEVFFPTKRRENMSQHDFQKDQARNIQRGEKFGTRSRDLNVDVWEEVKTKEKKVTELEKRVETLTDEKKTV